MRFRKPVALASSVLAVTVVMSSTTPARAIQPTGYAFSGTQVTLANAETGGPALTPGLHRTQLPNDGSPRSFTVNRNQLRTFVASVLTYEKNGSNLLLADDHETEVKITSPDGDDCDTQKETLREGEPAGIVVTNVGFDDDEKLSRNGYVGSTCREATTLNVTVAHTGGGAGSTDAEILITDEPKGVGDTGAAASAAERTAIKAPAQAPKDEVAPGTGFAGAATLTPGTYPVKLKVGARIFYKVRLDWGQRLAATMTVPAKDSNFGSPIALESTISIWSPQRIFLGVQPKDYQFSREASMSANNSEVKTIGSYTAAVRWANRSASSGDNGEIAYATVPFTSVPGWYYVSVNTQPRTPVSSDTPVPATTPDVPAELSVAVVGEAQPGPRLVNSAGAEVAAPSAGQLSVGNGVSQDDPFPWVKTGLSAVAILAAGAAVVWGLRRKA